MSEAVRITNAPCQSTDPEIFFPDSSEFEKIRNAKNLCGQCNQKTDCLSFAMTQDIRYGIWGGLTETERKALKRKQYRSKTNG